jgi:hypothetical protein
MILPGYKPVSQASYSEPPEELFKAIDDSGNIWLVSNPVNRRMDERTVFIAPKKLYLKHEDALKELSNQPKSKSSDLDW